MRDIPDPAERSARKPQTLTAAAVTEMYAEIWAACLRGVTAEIARSGPRISHLSPEERCLTQEASLRDAWKRMPLRERQDKDVNAFVERLRSRLQPDLDEIYRRNNYE
jgi:hypothetical protein